MKVICKKSHCAWKDEFGICAMGAKKYNGNIVSVCIYGDIVKTTDDNKTIDDNPPPTVKIITKDATTNLITIINLKGDTVPDETTAQELLRIVENYCNNNYKLIRGRIRDGKIKYYFGK